MKRVHLVFREGKSDKFWEVAVRGKSQIVRYGRSGTEGRTVETDFASSAEAKASAMKLAATKRKKGYTEPKEPPSSQKPKKPPRKSAKKGSSASRRVEQQVAAITRWLSENEPDPSDEAPAFWPEEPQFWAAKKPAKPAAIRKAEKSLGLELPDSYKAYLAIHNGTEDIANVVWGPLHQVEDIGAKSAWLSEILDDEDDDDGFDARHVDARIRPVAFSEKWIAISTSARNRDHLCLDLDPNDGGVVGQVIRVSSDSDDHEWLAASFADFLDYYLEVYLKESCAEPKAQKRKKKKRTPAPRTPKAAKKNKESRPPAVNASDYDELPRDAEREEKLASWKPSAFSAWGKWLVKQDHPLGPVVLADLAAEKEPPRQQELKRRARELFQQYVDGYYRPRFPKLAPRMEHFTKAETFSFRYGVLDRLDNFDLQAARQTQELKKMLSDPHAFFARAVALGKWELKNLKFLQSFKSLRQLNLDWSDISKVPSLEPIAGMKFLVALDVGGSAVRDLSPLKELPIVQLFMSHTKVTDLTPLRAHPTLQYIGLAHTRIKDITPLTSCKKLCSVSAYETRVPEGSLADLDRIIGKSRAKPSRDEFLIQGFEKDGVFE